MDIMDELARIQAEENINNGVVDTDKQPFVMVYNTFILNENYTINQKMMFLALKSFGGNKNNCYPSKETLAKKLSLSKRTVATILKQLEELGAIVIINRYAESNRKTSNIYILASIDINTGNFISNTLNQYRTLKETGIKVKGK
ncbi:MAG: helix-turn-helix domain-containing protein [Lachnospirales bacterium]